MRFTLFLLFFTLIHEFVHSQHYIPADTIYKKNELVRFFEDKTKLLETEFRSYDVVDKKIIKRFVDDRKEMFHELTEGNYFFFDQNLENYINNLLKKIAEQNGIESKGLRIFLSRDTAPNAYSLGDGNFVFTISLLNRLENEEELYFIISHELAHYYLGHLKKQMKASMQLKNSNEYIQKKKEIKKSKYKRFTRSIEQYRELQYGNLSTRRLREKEADSLGFVFVSGLIKSPMNAISALRRLDTISPSEFLKIDLKVLEEHFSSETMPFNEKWTNGYDFSKYNYQKGKTDIFGTHKDSLKTHPDIEERVLYLSKKMPDSIPYSSNSKDEFVKLKERIRMEDVYSHYCLDEYGRGIYLILQLKQLDNITEKQELFYNYMLSLFYQELTEARKSFKFKKYVDDINYVNHSEEYILFLTIIDNMRSSELNELANNYKTNQ